MNKRKIVRYIANSDGKHSAFLNTDHARAGFRKGQHTRSGKLWELGLASLSNERVDHEHAFL